MRNHLRETRERGNTPRVPTYEAVASTLSLLGADTVFGIIGRGNFYLTQRLVNQHGAKWYWARQETAAVTMADAWARATGRVGVCTLTQGPGLTNAITGLAEAAKARTPMLVVTGEVETGRLRTSQRIDQDALAAAAGAIAERVLSPDSSVDDTTRAWQRALWERRPVVLSFPADIQHESCVGPGAAIRPPSAPPPTIPSRESIARAADCVADAHLPLVLAGRGAVNASARGPLEQLADRIGALLATSAPAHGLFDGNPWSLGIAGAFASPRAKEFLPKADLLLAFGASLDERTTRYGELIDRDATLVLCDDDPAASSLHEQSVVTLLGDATEAAVSLVAELDRRGLTLGGFRAQFESSTISDPGWRIEDESTHDAIDPRVLMLRLEEELPRARNLTTDGGHFQGFPPMHLSVPDPRSFIFTQEFATIGLGLPTGVGTAVARSNCPTVAVVGDGGLMMSLGELDAAISHHLPLLVVIMDDGAYGAEVHHFSLYGERTELVEFGLRDFAGVARALGADAGIVRTKEDLDGLLDHWLNELTGPFVLDCKVNPNVRADWWVEDVISRERDQSKRRT